MGRNWSDLRWIAYRSYLTKDEVEERWGKEAADQMEYKKQMVSDSEDTTDDPDTNSVWIKAEIWEVWDKDERKIHYVALNGPKKVLESKEDPLGLQQFFPSPPFFLANPTTSFYSPVPDFHIAQDLYNEIDKLQTRISIITEAVKVVGVYDSSSEGIQRMFKEGVDNTLIPVENWAMFGEKGGLQGSIDWFPLEDVVNGLVRLREIRDETIQLLYQITGMADILRGGDGGQYEAAATSQMKAKFASVRVQALQDQFSKFASDLMSLKAEVIMKHFSPETIAAKSNIENSFDRQLAPEALRLLKDPQLARMRVKIRPESVAMVDYAQLKQERTEYINAIAMFMQSAAPMLEGDPKMKPYLFQLLQWGLSGFKGASDIEGVLDQAIEQAMKDNQKPEQDPAAAQAQAAAQMEMQKIQAKAQADMQIRAQDMQADIQTAQAQSQAKMQETQAELQASIAEIQAKLEADILLETVKAQSIQQTNAAQVEGEIAKDVVEAEIDAVKQAQQTADRIAEIAANAEAKIKEQREKAKEKPSETGESEG